MPAKSKAQQRLFQMALAVRKGDLPRNKVWKSVLDIVDSNMTNKEIEDFTIMEKSTLKSLYVFIKESLEQDKEFIKQSIDSLPDEDIQEIMDIITNNKPQMDKDEYYNYLLGRGIEDVAKNILRIAKDNKQDYANLVKLVNGGEGLKVPTSQDLVKNTNIYKLFGDVFSKDTLYDLSELKPPKNSTARGSGEILCRLILQDATNGSKGDVTCGDVEIEFKVNGGRVKGRTPNPPSELNRKTEELLGISLKSENPKLDKEGIFSKQENVEAWFELVEKYKPNDVMSILAQVLSAQYSGGEENATRATCEKAIKNYEKDLANSGKTRLNTLQKLIGCAELRDYAMKEKFDYILVGATSGKGQKDLCDYTTIPFKDAIDMTKTMKNNSIKFAAWPKLNASADQEYVEQIHLNK